jgi:hypothetical protein
MSYAGSAKRYKQHRRKTYHLLYTLTTYFLDRFIAKRTSLHRIEPSTAHPEMSTGQREGKAAQRHHFNTRHPPIA